MSSRISSVSRTPISERIKLFDSGSTIRHKPSPGKLGDSPAPSTPQSPLLKTQNTTATAASSARSQFSTRDPTNGNISSSSKPTTSSVKKSPTVSSSSSKSDLSRTSSNASTKSSDLTASTRSPLTSVTKSRSAAAANGRNSPSPPAKKVVQPSPSPIKKVTATRTNSGRTAPNPTTSSSATPRKDEPRISTTVAPEPSTPPPTRVSDPPGIAPLHRDVPPPVETPSRRTSNTSYVAPAISPGSDSSTDVDVSMSIGTPEGPPSPDTVDTVDMAPVYANTSIEIMEQNAVNRKFSSGSSYTNGVVSVVEEKLTANNSYWSRQALGNPSALSISQVNTQAMKLDVETKDEKISLLQKEITEIQMGGTTEEEVRNLKKGKRDLEMQLKEQEEELDDLAAQVQMLEASRTKLEMEMAAIKKEHRRELGNKDEEIEEARASANKKVKILEQQLEQEHEERIMFLRERHELEQKIGTLQDMLERSGDEEQVSKLKKDLKKTKALLRDAQTLVEKNQNEGTNKVILRQLKNQLEDAEFARTAAMKARQNAELELADTMTQLEDVSRNKQELEDRHLRLGREKAELASQLQENEEELQEVMRKYKASVAAVSTDQITIQDQQTSIQELENERNKLRDQVAELSSRLGNLEGENVSTSQHKRLELKVRELENKLELEVTSKNRLETQIARLKECIDKLGKEKDECKVKEQNSVEQQKKMARQLRDLKEDFTSLQGKETELGQKKFDLEKQLEVAEAETLTIRSDLKLALKRIEDLQAALVGEIDSDNSDDNSDSSDGEMHSFLEHHRRAMSVQRERESMARESVLRDSVGRDSVLRESVSRELRGSVGRTFSALEETLSVDRQFSSTIEEVDESLA